MCAQFHVNLNVWRCAETCVHTVGWIRIFWVKHSFWSLSVKVFCSVFCLVFVQYKSCTLFYTRGSRHLAAPTFAKKKSICRKKQRPLRITVALSLVKAGQVLAQFRMRPRVWELTVMQHFNLQSSLLWPAGPRVGLKGHSVTLLSLIERLERYWVRGRVVLHRLRSCTGRHAEPRARSRKSKLAEVFMA